jgi:hypothetical protein
LVPRLVISHRDGRLFVLLFFGAARRFMSRIKSSGKSQVGTSYPDGFILCPPNVPLQRYFPQHNLGVCQRDVVRLSKLKTTVYPLTQALPVQ